MTSKHADQPGSPTPTLGVVIPLASEEGTIAEQLDRMLSHLGSEDRVFCILDNACKDGTRAIVEQRSLDDARVECVWAPENRCVVDAYFRGYTEAVAAGCRWILEMDGGLSHQPEEIPRFVDAMKTGVDFAAGSRFCKGATYIGFGWRRLLSKGGTILANRVLHTKMKDMTSGFECFSREAMEHVLARGVHSRGHFFQTEIRFMLHNWRWVEVPISYRNPSKRVGKDSILEAFRNLWRLRKQAARTKTRVGQ